MFLDMTDLLFRSNKLTDQEKLKYYHVYDFQKSIQEALSKVLYLGPFRQSPSRRYPTRGASPSEVGAMGESTITMLANEAVKSQQRKHSIQIQKWLSDLGLAKKMSVARIGKSDLFDVSVTLKDDKAFPIADLGYGLSQILPVLTQCSHCPMLGTLLFEQPELHLHPLAARKLARVFVDTAKEKSAKILIETHAIEMVGELQRLIREGVIPASSVSVYHVERKNHQSKFTKIQIDDEGETYQNFKAGFVDPDPNAEGV